MLCQSLKSSLIMLSSVFLISCVNSPSALKKPETSNKAAHRIYSKLPEYQALARLEWQPIHVARLPLKPGKKDPNIPLIRQRLVLLGDLNSNEKSDSQLFDRSLKVAVEHFQWRHGLEKNGVIDKKTMMALNVTPQERLRSLKNNMDKLAEFPENVGSHYIKVNVANFDLSVIKDGKKVLGMKVIAGKTSRPTPEIYSKVQTIVLNPKWNIPRKIMRQDIIPKMIKNPNYLTEENIRIYSGWENKASEIDPKNIDWEKAQQSNFKYRMSQPPGEKNALGRVKFVFLNNDDIYMHDTPAKNLFSKVERAFSSGCIRLEKPFQLVEYFISQSDSLRQEKMDEKLASGKTAYVKIKNPIPVYITYVTAWVDKNGYAHFREDIYHRDR